MPPPSFDATEHGPDTGQIGAKTEANQIRSRRMSVLAKAQPDRLEALWQKFDAHPKWQPLKATETGMVMVRGRLGGTGDAFNLGETTVTRAAVRLEDGRVGLSYVAGRDHQHAETAAVLDALLQGQDDECDVERAIIRPIETEAQDSKARRARKTAATKVDFFTVVREREA